MPGVSDTSGTFDNKTSGESVIVLRVILRADLVSLISHICTLTRGSLAVRGFIVKCSHNTPNNVRNCEGM